MFVETYSPGERTVSRPAKSNAERLKAQIRKAFAPVLATPVGALREIVECCEVVGYMDEDGTKFRMDKRTVWN